MLFYFTGTGNSLYAAKRIEENPISIPQVMHQELNFKDERIGIVAPIYGHEVPTMVKEFMKNAHFETDYFYMILTYGNRHGGASELAKKLCDEYGLKVNYIQTLLMVDNFLLAFDMDEQRKIDKQIDSQLQKITTDIKNKIDELQPVTDIDRDAHRQFLENRKKMPADAFTNLYKVTEACIHCGICTKVCPAGCIHIEGDKVLYDTDKCQSCMACIHNCPQKAIQLLLGEKNSKARYRNEHITLQEIIKANQQNK